MAWQPLIFTINLLKRGRHQTLGLCHFTSETGAYCQHSNTSAKRPEDLCKMMYLYLGQLATPGGKSCKVSNNGSNNGQSPSIEVLISALSCCRSLVWYIESWPGPTSKNLLRSLKIPFFGHPKRKGWKLLKGSGWRVNLGDSESIPSSESPRFIRQIATTLSTPCPSCVRFRRSRPGPTCHQSWRDEWCIPRGCGSWRHSPREITHHGGGVVPRQETCEKNVKKSMNEKKNGINMAIIYL